MKHLFVLSLLLVAPLAAAKGPAARFEPYTFQARDGRTTEAELGTFSVPVRHGHPKGPRLTLRFVRFPATGKARAAAPIVYLAGGPGGSGIDAASGPRYELFLALRELGDVIALDQRGTGQSEPERKGLERAWSVPWEEPMDEARLTMALRQALAEAAPAWAAAGVDVGAFNTEESVEDLESLRQALGVPRLRLWGISYGTHLGIAYLKRHAARVERAVLAGIEGPDDTWKSPAQAEALLARWEVRLQARGQPDLRARLGRVLEALKTTPRRVPLRDPRTGTEKVWMASAFDIQCVAFELMRGPEGFPRFVELLGALEAGSFEVMAPLVPELRGGTFSMMSMAMDAASGMSPARRARIAREASTALLGGAVNAGAPEAAWVAGVEDLGEAFRAPVRARTPVLLISGTLDGRTPVDNAEALRSGLPRSVHLVLEGAGHDGLFQGDPRILERLRAFFRGDRLRDERLQVPDVSKPRPPPK
ncbi:alpha/beta fold hydrolase [Corallococcus sp. bb12-1]|uniref:alpha/beta fold hydrolase n=1 Tax=Corallococcus sp. bb12-1 TaxID=2996784 RepID=UPI00226F7318|nr:alpha/beta fold hydrolase [Corallococcus sp. bb12-1]MCY1041954.1 alpha/beta fold hydrolase [Corallococcus sp. bb12-1]